MEEDSLIVELERIATAYMRTTKVSAQEIAGEIRASAARLRIIVGDPNFAAAAKAERDALALRVGIKAVKLADAADRTAFAALDVALGVLARA